MRNQNSKFKTESFASFNLSQDISAISCPVIGWKMNYRLFRFKTDWQTAVLWPYPAIFLQLYEHLSQNWDSDGHFEVLVSFKS